MTITSLSQTCTAMPSQWEGTLDDGRYIYIRYRWGVLTASVGSTPDEAVDHNYIHHEIVDDTGWGGRMTTEDMLRRIATITKG